MLIQELCIVWNTQYIYQFELKLFNSESELEDDVLSTFFVLLSLLSSFASSFSDDTTSSSDDSKGSFAELFDIWFVVACPFNFLSWIFLFLFSDPPFLSPDSIKNFCKAVLNWLGSYLSLWRDKHAAEIYKSISV